MNDGEYMKRAAYYAAMEAEDKAWAAVEEVQRVIAQAEIVKREAESVWAEAHRVVLHAKAALNKRDNQ